MLSRDEVDGLMVGLLTSDSAPIGVTRPDDWVCDNGDGLGRRYVSEIRRNFKQRRWPSIQALPKTKPGTASIELAQREVGENAGPRPAPKAN